MVEEEYQEAKEELFGLPKIFVNMKIQNLTQLKNKYPAVNIDKLIEKKVKYYQTKPFKSKTKLVWLDKIKGWVEFINEDWKEDPLPAKELKVFTDRLTQADLFKEGQPFFYDKNKIWWFWNKDKFCHEIVDEVSNRYARLHDISQHELRDLIEDLRSNWARIKQAWRE